MECLMGELVYSNYRFNREQSPETPPKQWVKIFGPQSEQLEERYQMELATDGNVGDVHSYLAEKRYEAGIVEESRAIVEGTSDVQASQEHLRVLLSRLDDSVAYTSKESKRFFYVPF